MHNAILKPCAEKEKFATLVQEVEQKLKIQTELGFC